MGDPKLVRGMLGWAAIGDGLIVYAKTKAEAERRFRAAQEADSSDQSTDSTADVVQDVESAASVCHPEEPKTTKKPRPG